MEGIGLTLLASLFAGVSLHPADAKPPAARHEGLPAALDLDIGPRGSGAYLSFALDRYTKIEIQTFRYRDGCESFNLVVDRYADATHAYHVYVEPHRSRDDRAWQLEVALPAGSYRVAAQRGADSKDDCRALVTVDADEDRYEDSDFEDPDQREERKARQEQRALETRLAEGLIERGRGDVVNLSSLKIVDMRRLMHSGLSGAPDDEPTWWASQFETFCSYSDEKEKSDGGTPGEGLVSDQDDKEKDEIIREMVGLSIERQFKTATGMEGGEGFGDRLSKSRLSKAAVCQRAAIPYADVVKGLMSSATPRYHITFDYSDMVPEEAITRTFQLDQVAAMAEILGEPYDQIVVRYHHGECNGTIALQRDESGMCRTAAIAEGHFDRSTLTPRLASDEEISHQVFSADQIKTVLSGVLTGAPTVAVVLDTGSTMRLKVTGLKGAVVHGGSDWETVYVTIVQSSEESKLHIDVIVEGLLASGIGGIVPVQAAFTRSMDVEDPQALQEFAGRLLAALSHSRL